MEYAVPVVWLLWVFAFGLGIGSFLNVLIARLPYEKSPIWPGSRCGSCLQPIRLRDNLPILGYLLLRGKCRQCGVPFSPRYLWVELGTGLAFAGLFYVDVLSHAVGGPDWIQPWQHVPGLQYNLHRDVLPPFEAWGLFAFHACLLSLLIAAAVIDAEHKIIPAQITYFGTLVGILGATLMPWPWPSTAATVVTHLPGASWLLAEAMPQVPTGSTLWPFVGPPPDWAPAGSYLFGFLNGLIGAAAGMFVGRIVKFLFETGLGKEALGLGDADLLMMAGAFLGWQVAVLALPMGAIVTLPIVLPMKLWHWIRKSKKEPQMPFGPGLAAGVAVTWLAWPWICELARVFFDLYIVGFIAIVMGGGMLVAGLLLNRGEPTPEPEPAKV